MVSNTNPDPIVSADFDIVTTTGFVLTGFDYNAVSTAGNFGVSATNIRVEQFKPGFTGQLLFLNIDGDLRHTTSGTLAVDPGIINGQETGETVGAATRLVNAGGTITAAVVPEPASALLMGVGVLLLLGLGSRRRTGAR